MQHYKNPDTRNRKTEKKSRGNCSQFFMDQLRNNYKLSSINFKYYTLYKDNNPYYLNKVKLIMLK